MKPEQKISFFAVIIIFLVMGVVYFFLQQVESQALVSALRRVHFNQLTVGIPRNFYPGTQRDSGGWHIVTFQSRQAGTIELATVHAAGRDFKKSAVRYFSMAKFPESTEIYRAKGSFWFVKNMTADNIPGVLAIRTRGQRRVFTYFFSYGGISYWLSYSNGRSLSAYASLFFRVMSSLEANGKSLHGNAFRAGLTSVCREGYFVFCQPILFFLLLPAGIGVLIFGAIALVSKRLGRLPDMETLNSLSPFFTRANVSVMIRIRGKSQIMSLALVANANGIQLFQFGKPFVEILRTKVDQWELTEGRSWFGGPYFQVKAPAEELVRVKPRLLRWYTGPMTVRIYFDQPGMLRQYLM